MSWGVMKDDETGGWFLYDGHDGKRYVQVEEDTEHPGSDWHRALLQMAADCLNMVHAKGLLPTPAD